ncbi:MAG: sugar phosphate isomerase/epimerase [Clostridia bacterium]|nr:sugar phosphate isomerase/epimerase [Clostridia bacterium]MBQ6093563.1 sugar phosphate isomerase/epimerase [Clostridia bacterium]
MIVLKIGVCVNLTQMEDMPQKFEDLTAWGFDNCQLICWNPALFTAENAAKLHELTARCGVTVSAFWCGWEGPCVWNFYEGQTTLGLVPPEYREMRIRNLCDGADFANLLGVKNVVTHMGFIPENPNDPQFLPFCDAVRAVAQHCKANGQYLLFETGQETPVTMLRCFEQVGTDNLGVNLDTANVILYGKANPVDALDVFGKYVMNLHAKDGCYPTNGHDLGNETPIGQGRVDFPALFRKLHALGYDGYVTIEREISGEQQIKDVLAAKEYLGNIIDQIYGGH